MEVATSALAGLEASIRAGCSSVGAPPNAAPHTATAVTRTAWTCPYKPRASMAVATRAAAPSRAGRRWRSTTMPVIHIPATVAAPNTNRTRAGWQKPECAANGTMYVWIAWCAVSRSNVTSRTVAIPGRTATRRSGVRAAAASPGKLGTFQPTQATRSTARAASRAKLVRQPKAVASAVPAGMPRESAMVIPARTMAVARPRRAAGTLPDPHRRVLFRSEAGSPAEGSGQRGSGGDAEGERDGDTGQDDGGGAAAAGGGDHTGGVASEHRPHRAPHGSGQQPGREGQRVGGREGGDRVEHSEAGERSDEHRAAAQAAQRRGERDRGEGGGDRECAHEQAGTFFRHVQRAAHLRQHAGREQVGHHVSKCRRGQGKPPAQGESPRPGRRSDGIRGGCGAHSAMVKPSH